MSTNKKEDIDKIKRPAVDEIDKISKKAPESKELKERLDRISKEFEEGFKFLEKCENSVSFFGSSRHKFNHKVYKEARDLAYKLSKEGFEIVTGGGP
ncbi:MAG: TIGR00730 family Rossman fold protein, partial [Candidatus Paceibacterota bacterium]